MIEDRRPVALKASPMAAIFSNQSPNRTRYGMRKVDPYRISPPNLEPVENSAAAERLRNSPTGAAFSVCPRGANHRGRKSRGANDGDTNHGSFGRTASVNIVKLVRLSGAASR